ncbi:MAG: hypothetical protein V4446_10995 [Pseudomonadota bacterium]
MAIPHHFPSLIEAPTTQTVLIIGTGLSYPYAPTVDGLKDKLVMAAEGLGVVPDGDFYELAEAVLNSLAKDGLSDAASRLWLAEALDLLDDRRWFGETGLPLSGNTPRHRAIARFAVDKRLRAIISLNWDTLLEAALDSVGLNVGERPSRPWEITARVSVIDDTHMSGLANAHIFPVIKPHGCVRNLEQARRQSRSTGTTPQIVFKLTQSELDKLPAGQSQVDKRVDCYLSECPLITIGWKASEGYLRNTVIKAALASAHPETDSFTMAFRSWYEFHEEIAAAYSKTKLESFAEVGNVQPTLDCLFLWLQARYALNKLKAALPASQATIQQFLHELDQPVFGHFVLRWVDGWLHTWVRLCWRTGVMEGIDPHTGQKIEPWDIPVMPRDVHVPLGGMTVVRRELQAAAKLLVVLGSDLSRFDFEKYPGGFWYAETRSLYIPLPGWRSAALPADLAALKPLVEALRGLGFIQDIYLVWLDTEDTPPDQAYRNQLAAQVSRLMPLQKFAQSGILTWIDLEALKGVLHEPVA